MCSAVVLTLLLHVWGAQLQNTYGTEKAALCWRRHYWRPSC